MQGWFSQPLTGLTGKWVTGTVPWEQDSCGRQSGKVSREILDGLWRESDTSLLKSTERRPAWLEQQVPPRKWKRGQRRQGWEGLTLWLSQGPRVRKIWWLTSPATVILAGYFTPQSLHFYIHKMGIIQLLSPGVAVRIWDNIYKVSAM